MSDSEGEGFPRSSEDGGSQGGFPRNNAKERPKIDPDSKPKQGRKKKKFKNKGPKPGSEKKGRLIVRNVPFNATEKGLLDLFQQYGLVTEVKLLRKPDGKLVGCGFVNYENAKSAAKAIAHVSGKPFEGRPLIVDWAVPKTVYKNVVDHDFKVGEMKPKQSDVDLPDKKFSKKFSKTSAYESANENRNDARLFITNLPFRISEDDLRDYFNEHGPVVDLFIIKKGLKQMGNGFVTFASRDIAAEVMEKLEGKEFQGRPLYYKWALPKNQAQHPSENGNLPREPIEVKEEVFSDDETYTSKNKRPKESFTEDSTLDDASVKSEDPSESEDDDDSESDSNHASSKANGASTNHQSTKTKEEEDDDESTDDDEGSDDSDDDKTDADEDDESDDDSPKTKNKKDKAKSQNLNGEESRKSNDITEGLTVFLRNVPFDVDNNELKNFIKSRFGPVYYALVCMDSATEHSRGTAFIKFRNKDSVDAILNAQDDLVMHGELMQASMALSRDEIDSKHTVKSKAGVKNDNRNLYLSKEGLILAGSKAAKDVSLSDMNKRLSVESIRARLLKKNLLMFVSKTRLVIYNLPPNYTDDQLRKLFKKHAPKSAVITEARVMKDMKKFNAQATFASREFGYVSFTTHEDALMALRNINNNPDVFSKTKRPIVLFSIENRQAIATKEKRIEKSKKNNPLFTGETPRKSKFEKKNKSKSSTDQNTSSENLAQKDKEFQGFTASVGKTVLKSGYKVWKQAQTHAKNVKKVKKLQRQKRQMAQLLENKEMQKGVFNKTKKRKQPHELVETKDDQKFERFVSEHKSDDAPVVKKYKKAKINADTGEMQRKKKWYST